jgi:Flp pilus assembly protein TadG
MFDTMRNLKDRLRRLGRIASPRRFARRQEGAAAIEFAIVALPFLALILGTMETALVFFADQTLETMVQTGARLIMTGQAQNNGWNGVAAFKNQFCPAGQSVGLFNCDQIFVNVQSYGTFGAISSVPAPPTNNGVLDPTKQVYQPGTSCNIVIVQLYYQWPIIVTFMGFNHLANFSNSSRLLTATAAFRNEPFGGTGVTC